jgi:serine/threonine protein kinase
MTSDSSATCPKCRTPLPPSAPRGLCPACLMDAAGGETEVMPTPAGFGAPLDLDTLRRAFPQLEILAPLGAGGMGRVYKVRQPNLDRLAALKVLPPDFARDPAWVERFTREARALARLNHPNIVQVYDVGQTSGGRDSAPLCWLLMEYVDGVTLRQVQRTGGLSAREALALVPKLCDALQYAHEKGVLHRDIKPENILLDSAGTAKIADFGLAKLAGPHPSPTLTITGARLGTAAYMAPEQIESPSDVDHRADIYSLGVVLYELLTGGLPLGRFPAPSEKSGTDPRLDHIVFRTLEKERERRYQAAGEVRSALETVAQSPGTPIGPQPREFRQSPPAAATEAPRSEPPPLKQTVQQMAQKAVRFLDRHKRFPAAAAEATGHGCGMVFLFLLRLSLCFVPMFIPILWFESMKELDRDGFHGAYPSSMIWVTAATGLAAWLCVQPLLRMTKWAEANWIKRKAPLLLLLAVVLWGGMLAIIANASSTWPTRGVAGRLHFAANRPPLAGTATITSDAALDAMFRDVVMKEFLGAPDALLGGTGLPARGDYYDASYYRTWDTRENALRKTWTVAVVTESLPTLEARLLRIAEAMTATLPESVRPSIVANWNNSIGTRSFWRFDLMRDENLFILAALMTLGGWFAGFTRGRPLLHGMVPFLLIAGTITFHVAPPGWIPGGRIVPAKDPREPLSMEGNAMESLTTLAKTDPEAAALQQWIGACRRLDRNAAQLLSGRPLDDRNWEHTVSLWHEMEPLAIVRDNRNEEPNRPGTPFACILIPRGTGANRDAYSLRSYYSRPGDLNSKTVSVRVEKAGESYVVYQ